MKVGLALSFEENSMDGSFLYFLFKKYIRFNPYSFTLDHKGMQWNEKKHTEKIRLAKKEDQISVIDQSRNIFSVTTTGARHPHQSVLIEQEKTLFYPTNEEINDISNSSKSFVAGYLYNEEYTHVQSSISETLFEDRNIADHILGTLK